MFAHYDERVEPEFDRPSGTYRVRHDPDGAWPVSTTVVYAVVSLTGAEPLGLLPLHDAVDTDVLDRHVRVGASRSCLSFRFHGYDVTARGDGLVEFDPIDGRVT